MSSSCLFRRRRPVVCTRSILHFFRRLWLLHEGITKLSDISWNDEEETMKSRNQTWAKMNTLEAKPFDENVCWTPQKSTVETSRLTVRGWCSPGPNRSRKSAHRFQTFFLAKLLFLLWNLHRGSLKLSPLSNETRIPRNFCERKFFSCSWRE